MKHIAVKKKKTHGEWKKAMQIYAHAYGINCSLKRYSRSNRVFFRTVSKKKKKKIFVAPEQQNFWRYVKQMKKSFRVIKDKKLLLRTTKIATTRAAFLFSSRGHIYLRINRTFSFLTAVRAIFSGVKFVASLSQTPTFVPFSHASLFARVIFAFYTRDHFFF